MKKLIVDDSVCMSCGMCAAMDEEHFMINDKGLSEVKSQENLESETLKNVIDSCPVSAIKLAEEVKDNTIKFPTQNDSANKEDQEQTNPIDEPVAA